MEQRLKLSEAIRKGAKLRPMAIGDFFGKSLHGDSYHYYSCALGAAYETIYGLEGVSSICDECGVYALTLKTLRIIDGRLLEAWPILQQTWRFTPPDDEGTERPITLQEVIQDTNDSGKFTREEIADWLESIGE